MSCPSRSVLARCVVPAALAIAAVLVCAPAAASAQECDEIRWELRNKYNPFTNELDLVRVPVCYRNGVPSTRPHTKRAKPKATRRQLGLLRFKPSAKVSETVRTRLLAELVGDSQDPSADKARETISSGSLLSQFQTSLGQQHWSTRDAGDIYAYAYIVCWLGANEKTKVSDAVRRGGPQGPEEPARARPELPQVRRRRAAGAGRAGSRRTPSR